MHRLATIFLILVALSENTFAYAPREGNVTALAGPFTSKANFAGSHLDLQAPQLGGFGLIALGDIDDKGSLEIGMIYMHKLYLRDVGPNHLVESMQSIHITMGYRRWLGERFSASLTFFSAYPMGDPEVIDQRLEPGFSMDTSAQDLTEYGLDFSLQTELWASGRYALVLDTRYSASLTSKKDERGDHYGALLGIRYLLQGP